ncbi:nucleoside-diphosphate kinase [Stappia indica]|uniref:nucleoside-diphosphate kinase n=1 Tax=Stappia indica TaxID=538381 RepID=UPI001D185EFD|nr:nucleoside-diphosphate kinase [Stappia indica]MCC4243839.1 nucleoside-diphosphate kinase [Stappia indica]
MSIDTCILTTKDFTLLEVMRDRRRGHEDPLVPILKRKLETATVVFREDVPETVATLSSRVTYSVDGRTPDTRVISHDHLSMPMGMFLPITTRRGLALLGLSEGEEFLLQDASGRQERILLQKVHFQPEAARRSGGGSTGETGETAAQAMPEPARRRPLLKLVHGALAGADRPRAGGYNGPEEPGPSAA